MKNTIFFNANILTQDPAMPRAEAVLVEQQKIKAVGSNADILLLRTAETTIHDLQGMTLLPGFNDAHIHIWKVGNLLTYMLDVRGIESLEALKSKLTAFAKTKKKGEWIMARGFNEIMFSDEKRLPNIHDMTAALPNNPLCLIRTCAHITIANQAAIDLTGIQSQTIVPEGGEIRLDEHGALLGIFTETAQGLIQGKIPEYTTEQYENMIDAAQEALLRAGITSATDPAVMPDLLAVYYAMEKAGKLKIRINAIPVMLPDGGQEPLPVPDLYQSHFLNINTVKFFSDGGLSGKTAALLRHYKNDPYQGVLRLDKTIFYDLALEAQQKGFKIATHAIGDAAMELVTDVYQDLQKSNERKLRHRIEHVGLPNEKHLARMKDCGTHAVSQPIFIYELGKNFRNSLDDDYLKICYPYRSILDAGITLSFSSDAPVVKDFSPLMGIQNAVLRQDREGVTLSADEKINVSEAIHAYTLAAADANDDAPKKGSISVGKWADFVVLSEDITNTNQASIKDIEVLMTIVGGVVLFRDSAKN
jgi:predicted amidohydrolase YtcJ